MTKPHARLLVVVTAAAAACQRDGPPNVRSLDDILVTVPDSAMRELWRRAAAAGQLPALGTIPVPRQRVSRRVTASLLVPPAQPRPPAIPRGSVADVRVFSTTPVDHYLGAFVATDITPGRIVGRLGSGPEPFTILYKLPEDRPVPGLQVGAKLSFALRDEVVNGSLQRELLLSIGRSHLLLLSLSAGGRRPYTRGLEGLPLTIRQQAPGPDSISAVAITYFAHRFTLRPGEQLQVSDPGGKVAFFLMASQFPPRTQVQDGDPYHVILFVYRLE